ncbi:MAG: HEPN domain-containing protein [Candidatus Latescibacteria bacterium]|nr:HEPN domain-containing protein [Candidatus Latescibacterota bacterium]
MRTPDQAKWDFVEQWLAKAGSDLRVAQLLLDSDLEDFENVGFHAQQAAEKYIKAVLVRHQVEFPKTHDIGRLRMLVDSFDSDLAAALAPADDLTPYGVEFRYPGDLESVSLEQGQQVCQLAEQTRGLVLQHLKSYLDAGRP